MTSATRNSLELIVRCAASAATGLIWSRIRLRSVTKRIMPPRSAKRAARTRSRAVVSLKRAMRPFHTRHAGCPDEGPEQWDWLAARQTPDVDRAADSARRARDRGARSAAR